jgi:hypothetical protein
MTNTEFRKAVNESDNSKFFNSIELEINYPPSRIKYKLNGLIDIHEFYSTQVNSWEKHSKRIRVFQQSLEHFKQQLQVLENYFESHKKVDGSQAGARWRQIYQNFSNEFNFFVFESEVVDFLLNLNENENEYFSGAVNYFLSGNIGNSGAELKGFIKAYEFDNADNSILLKKKESEKRSFSSIKTQLRRSQTQLQEELDEIFKNEKERFEKFNQSIESIKENTFTDFDTWFEDTKKSANKLFEDTSKQAEDLVKSFKEHTRLKEPAKYWEERGKELNKEGWLAIKWLVGLTGFGCITLYALLWLTPEGMLLSFIKGEAAALKWSIVYITFISFLAVGIRSLNKVAFSSFHLARDAQERHQLTHVYLALVAEKDVDIKDEDRQLILQSLFSRSESGLLRQDSSPSMPSNVVEKFIKPSS